MKTPEWNFTDNKRFLVLNGNKAYVIRNHKGTKGWLWVADKVMGYEEDRAKARDWVEAFYELNEDEA